MRRINNLVGVSFKAPYLSSQPSVKGAHLERDKQKEQVSKLDDHTGSHVTGTPQLSFTEVCEQGNLFVCLFVFCTWGFHLPSWCCE